MNKIKKRKRS